jgi:hypothetical protein
MKTHVSLLLVMIIAGCSQEASRPVAPDDRPCIDSEKYGLPSITSDADSIEIRIWYSHAFLDRIPVVSIRQSKTGEWAGRLHIIVWSSEHETLQIKETKVKNLLPKTGWRNFYSSLEKLNISAIPDMNPEDGGLDGSSYTFEVEKDGSCRSYSYWMPENLQSRDPNAKSVVQILDEIENELEVSWGMRTDEQRKKFWTMALDSTLTSR